MRAARALPFLAATPERRVAILARFLLVAPFLVGAVCLLTEVFHRRAAFPWALLVVAAFIAGVAVRRRRAGAADSSQPAADLGALRTAAWIGLAVAIIVLAPQLVRPWIRVRADSWFHAAIVSEIERFGAPPLDPYFAGLKLQYMWFFHVMLFGLRELTGLSPFTLMVLLNATTVWALTVLVAELALALGLKPRAAVWSAVITPFGLTALFWVFLPFRAARAFVGRVGGPEELAAAFRLTPLDITTTRAFLSDFASSPFFLNKFLVGNAYGLALAFLVMYLIEIVRFVGGSRGRHLERAGLALLAMLFLHPVAGLTAVAVSGLVGVVLLGLGPARGGLPVRGVVRWGGQVAGAVVATLPYLRSVTRGKPREQLVPVHFNLWVVFGILVGCLLVIVAAAGPLRAMWREKRPAGRFFALWCVMSLVFASVIALPGPNTVDKFTYVVYLPLAVVAGAWAAERWRGGRGVVWAILVLAPANLIGYAGYWGDRNVAEPPAEAVAAYGWLVGHSPAEAVVLENLDRTDAVVRIPRRLYWGRAAYAEQWGYDAAEMAARRGVRDAVFDAGADSAATATALDRLQKFGAPVFIIFRAADYTSPDGFHRLERFADRVRPVYGNAQVAIYRVGL